MHTPIDFRLWYFSELVVPKGMSAVEGHTFPMTGRVSGGATDLMSEAVIMSH